MEVNAPAPNTAIVSLKIYKDIKVLAVGYDIAGVHLYSLPTCEKIGEVKANKRIVSFDLVKYDNEAIEIVAADRNAGT